MNLAIQSAVVDAIITDLTVVVIVTRLLKATSPIPASHFHPVEHVLDARAI